MDALSARYEVRRSPRKFDEFPYWVVDTKFGSIAKYCRTREVADAECANRNEGKV